MSNLPDAPPSKTVFVWAAYRQALRDLTETFASPDLVVRPTTPGG